MFQIKQTLALAELGKKLILYYEEAKGIKYITV